MQNKLGSNIVMQIDKDIRNVFMNQILNFEKIVEEIEKLERKPDKLMDMLMACKSVSTGDIERDNQNCSDAADSNKKMEQLGPLHSLNTIVHIENYPYLTDEMKEKHNRFYLDIYAERLMRILSTISPNVNVIPAKLKKEIARQLIRELQMIIQYMQSFLQEQIKISRESGTGREAYLLMMPNMYQCAANLSTYCFVLNIANLDFGIIRKAAERRMGA